MFLNIRHVLDFALIVQGPYIFQLRKDIGSTTFCNKISDLVKWIRCFNAWFDTWNFFKFFGVFNVKRYLKIRNNFLSNKNEIFFV